MTTATNLFSTDVLIIGGGISALAAANKAVEQGVDVLVVDKCTSGFSGQMPWSGGNFVTPPPDGVDRQIRFLVDEGEYLNDQEFTTTFIKSCFPAVKEVADWGIWTFPKDPEGRVILGRSGGIATMPQREMGLLAFKGRALQKGVRFVDKVFVNNLLTNQDRIVGAVGFHYETGEYYVFHAKEVILACGGCMYKSRPLWHVNCGEGVVMAFDAGAEFRNAEFGNMFHVSNKYTLDDGGGIVAAAWTIFENARGESLLQKHPDIVPSKDIMPPWMRGSDARLVRILVKEILEGNGPIYVDFSQHAPPPLIIDMFGERRGTTQFSFAAKLKRLGVDITKEKIEFQLVPEFHEGPVKVNLNSETTVPGLYAVGDLSFQGSACWGALDFYAGGNPLAYAMVTGFWAGQSAGNAAKSVPRSDFSIAQIEDIRKNIYAPFNVEKGYDPYASIKDIQEIVFKIKNSLVKSEERLKFALSKIREVKKRQDTLKAANPHELVRCHEAKAMAVCAEILYEASLLRTETRSTNIREDYPKRDDKNWLKWLLMRKDVDKIKFWTEPVPIEKYKYQLPKRQVDSVNIE